jgi:hypothetical protein
MTRVCDATGCTTQVPTGRFMCPRHWRMVPLVVQREVNAGYNRAANAPQLLRDARYLLACATAIEHVAELEDRPLTLNPYRQRLQALGAEQQPSAPAA